eukprot:949685-Rhodomonas_salina.1
MTSVVHYKFRNELTTNVARFEGEDISVPGLKAKIAERKGLTTRMYSDFDLTLMNDGTKDEYASEGRIPRNSVVLVHRKKLFKPTTPAPSARLAGVSTRPGNNHLDQRVGSSSDAVPMSPEATEEAARCERKRKRGEDEEMRKRVEDEKMYVGLKSARQTDTWHFRGTTEFQRRAAQRFLDLYVTGY